MYLSGYPVRCCAQFILFSQSADKLKDDARVFFDSLLDTYKSKMEVTLREQLEAIERAASTAGSVSVKSTITPEINSKSDVPRDLKNDDTRSAIEPHVLVKSAWGDEEDAPINILRDMLKGYMKTSIALPEEGVGLSGSERNDADPDIELFRKSVSREWQLVQVSFLFLQFKLCVVTCDVLDVCIHTCTKEVKMFLRNENDIVRKKQQELSKDREEWRRQYQQTNDNRYSRDSARAAKKVRGYYTF